jgi:hypothetical protein
MPPELLEQLGLEPCADTDPRPEDHEALGSGRRIVTPRALDEPDGRDRASLEEDGHGG